MFYARTLTKRQLSTMYDHKPLEILLRMSISSTAKAVLLKLPGDCPFHFSSIAAHYLYYDTNATLLNEAVSTRHAHSQPLPPGIRLIKDVSKPGHGTWPTGGEQTPPAVLPPAPEPLIPGSPPLMALQIVPAAASVGIEGPPLAGEWLRLRAGVAYRKALEEASRRPVDECQNPEAHSELGVCCMHQEQVKSEGHTGSATPRFSASSWLHHRFTRLTSPSNMTQSTGS